MSSKKNVTETNTQREEEHDETITKDVSNRTLDSFYIKIGLREA